jgi:hypothetical protein
LKEKIFSSTSKKRSSLLQRGVVVVNLKVIGLGPEIDLRTDQWQKQGEFSPITYIGDCLLQTFFLN